ncbi:MAG: hypothetical protein CMH25_05050 [Micavibrio sp.]|nr:hypothetical protein [Micavibrio sp.]|tara:strand:- start:47382 stop:48791 length:1410 start_codon:yes stop_codon:yes gene_type:complete
MRRTLALCSVLILSACSVGPDYEQPRMSLFDGWFSFGQDVSASSPINLRWWEMFEDPLLNQYIQQAAITNKDIEIAQSNLLAARAARRETTSPFFPEVSGTADGSRSRQGSGSFNNGGGQIRNLYQAGFDASWELDIFGGNRRAYEAADARVGRAIANYQDVLLSTLSEVTRTYYEARGLQKRIAITEQNADLQKQTFDLIETRAQVGEASEFDVSRAKSEYQLTLARVPNLKADLETSIYALSVLLGKPPEALLEDMMIVKPLPTPPDLVPVGLRSELLQRRPDIRMAERELAASVADIGVQTSELFPKFFLTGDIGTQARSFGDLFTSAAEFWSFGGFLDWSVFEGGAIRARIDIEKAENKAALAQYEKTVLEALADAEGTLSQYGQELETRQRLEEAVNSRRKSVSLARELLSVGEADYLAVLDAERELSSSEDELVLSETRSLIKLVSLYTALGGGWELFPADAQ